MQGHLADVQGHLADVQGHLADVQGHLADVQGHLAGVQTCFAVLIAPQWDYIFRATIAEVLAIGKQCRRYCGWPFTQYLREQAGQVDLAIAVGLVQHGAQIVAQARVNQRPLACERRSVVLWAQACLAANCSGQVHVRRCRPARGSAR